MSGAAISSPLASSRPGHMHQDAIRGDLIQTQLDEDQGRLFTTDTSTELIKFWESHLNNDEFIAGETRNTDALRSSLNRNLIDPNQGPADPVVRHVFLSAKNSQKPLSCTFESFKLLSAHHRVPSEFSQMLLSFGNPAMPGFVAFNQPRCHLDFQPRPSSPPSSSSSPEPHIPGGWEMRNCYKLSAMEPARTGSSWTMRQMAVFHSLDLTTGRSFTLTVKANNGVIASRIRSLPLGGEVVPATVAESLTASLETQLLYSGWCVEGWASYIDGLEQRVRQISDKVVGIPMHSEEKMIRRFTTVREEAAQEALPFAAKTGGEDGDNDSRHLFPRMKHWINNVLGRTGFSRPSSTAKAATTAAAATNIQLSSIVPGAPPPLAASSGNAGAGSLERLKKAADQQLEDLRAFPISGLQTLHSASTKLREAKLVMELNRGVLGEIREHYRTAFSTENDEIPMNVKEECRVAARGFQQRIRYLENLLLMECARIDALSQVASDSHGLYDSILQLQSGRIGQLFAADAQGASARMELVTRDMQEIARNTERDTASMHVITILALIFLPGTFLGVRLYYYSRHARSPSPSFLTDSQSFFSTPIFDGQAPEGASPSHWSFNKELFGLFAKICLPMMAVVLLLWGGLNWRAKRRSSSKRQAEDGDDKC